MNYTTEQLSNKITVQEYLKDYVDVPKFLACCQACPDFGKKWSCPPYDFNVMDYWNKFKYLYVIGTRIIIPKEETMCIHSKETISVFLKHDLGSEKKKLSDVMHRLEDQYPGSKSLAAGNCDYCKECLRLKGKPCCKPDQMRYSIESLGGDVGRTTKDLLGWELKWMTEGKLPEHFILVNGLLTTEDLGGKLSIA